MKNMVSRSTNERSVLLPLAERCHAPKPLQSYLEGLGTRPQKPYIFSRTSEAKAMTVVVGIPCSDGIVLAADQEISSPGWHKYHESKLFVVDGWDSRIVLGYSGLPSLAKEAREKIILGLGAIEKEESVITTNSRIRECVEKILTEMAQQHFNQLDLSLLIASSCSNYPELWKFNNAGFHGVYGEFEVLGAGDSSLVRYLQQAHSIHDSVETGESLAIFFVEKAKQNIEGCGGKTDVISIKNDGSLREIPEDEIQKRAAAMNGREQAALRSILLG
jgi:20S proteasome alpha/beta subunit